MARYRIEFTLRDKCPFDLTPAEIEVDGTTYQMDFDATIGSIKLAEFKACDFKTAARDARDIANRFLNYLFALSQFPGVLEVDYRYQNLDRDDEKRTNGSF